MRVKSFFKYYLFWILFFVVQKPLFMLLNIRLMGGVGWQEWFRVIWHALPLDLSVASYVTVVFGLLMVVSCFCPARIIARIADVYSGVVLAVALLLFIGDAGVFPVWGYHLDRTVFAFLRSPREVLACAEWWVWLCGITGLLIGWDICFLIYHRLMRGMKNMDSPDGWLRRIGYGFGLLLLTALLFLPIRGSLTTSTLNTGRVYFSDRQILNQAAINPVFNLVESLSGCTFDTQRYTYMPSDEARQRVAELLPRDSVRTSVQRLLKTPRPNIVLFILESFSANAWEAMPHLRQLAAEGVWFSNVFASSYRTDRGVVAVLSGFPGQPTSSLMLQPQKSQHLPQLSKSLAQEGYRLKFWYGGDEDFTNMRSYLISGGYMDRVSDHSFPIGQRLSKWGVHDHVLFREAAREIAGRDAKEPTLDVILSLSSHEPFEVPATRRFTNEYLNSIAYTDSCIGAFVDTLRRSRAWEQTLLVLVADHGFPYPYTVQNHEPARYRIPVVWAGGAVSHPQEIHTLCSQIDLVPTLLAQMEIDAGGYRFAKNALDSACVPFAFYSFNDGFALIREKDTVVIDAKADRRIIGTNDELDRQARAFIQCVMEAIEDI